MKKIANTAKQGRMDFTIFAVVILLCVFGLVMVLSSSYYYAYRQLKSHDGFYYVKKQAVYFIAGLAAMIVISRVPYTIYKNRTIYAAAFLLTLIGVFLVPIIGKEVNGAKRWLDFGFATVQPAELAKFAVVIAMSAYMANNREKIKVPKYGIIRLSALILAPLALGILFQRNLSMLVIVVAIYVVMLFIGEIPVKHMLVLGGMALAVMLLAVFAESYRLERVISFSNPWKDPSDTGYQLIQSLLAIGSGGIFGKGLNFSSQKLLFLTYGESDFIFAVIAEELGLVGCVILIGVYGFLIYRGVLVALKCRDRFGSMLAAGVTSVIAIQVIVHILVTIGWAPTTGQTLPFISAGGTSLVFFMAATGILLNVSRYTTNTAKRATNERTDDSRRIGSPGE